MHKGFYASGFLYHSPSQQILLQQFDHDDPDGFCLFVGKNRPGEDAITTFQRIVHEELGLKIPTSSIHPVYDYFHEDLKMDHYIHYAEVTHMSVGSKLPKRSGWVSLKKLSKVKLAAQIRHDIIIGERVIRASAEEQARKPSL